MPRRKRPNPFSEGDLQVIYEKFFKKIVEEFCPEDRSHKEFLEDLFDVDHTIIKKWKVKQSFVMPGLFHAAANVKIQGIGYRKVARYGVLISRENDRFPDVVTVDFLSRLDGTELVYSLNASEWGKIRLNLVSMEEA